jgi:hypothetical protein
LAKVRILPVVGLAFVLPMCSGSVNRPDLGERRRPGERHRRAAALNVTPVTNLAVLFGIFS